MEVMGIWLGTIVTIAGSFLVAFFLGTSAARPNLSVLPEVTEAQFEIDATSEVEVINAGHFEPWLRGAADESLRENL